VTRFPRFQGRIAVQPSSWEQWHENPAFRDTAERLKGLKSDAGTPTWHEVGYAGGRFHA
jgi:hypothetical protein